MRGLFVRIFILVVTLFINIVLIISIMLMKTLNREDAKDLYSSQKFTNISCEFHDNEKHSSLEYLIKYIQPENDIKLVEKQVLSFLMNNKYETIYNAFKKYEYIDESIVYFPVASYKNEEDNIGYEDSWNAPRSYGGNRKHEGCDIFGENKSGYYPIVSVSSGVVKHLGWLELGGYRVGVITDSGIYYYYAHLDSFAPDLKEGDRVSAGQILGFMGDTGYGEEGTHGKFDVHLHFGIYVLDEKYAINPYYQLEKVKDKMLVYEK